MTLEELQQSVSKDFKLDDTELDSESVSIPLLHNKYLIHFNKFSLLLKKAEYEHRTMIKDKWEYYTGKADPSVYKEKPFDIKVLKSDVHIYMDSDPELQRADQKVAYLNQIVKYLEQVLRGINNRSFLIKNAIEWKKFTSGAI
ncbi:MAG: recombination mediator protein UvsY [Pelagibacteraceae bacterium]|nr:recombination mediator protein UvsY [Pelagibacteraceae bacterium]|tara:strand:- start:298 stop:726 length:429 start_codon:yes stop_codon:yes gene_type:complete